MEVFILPLAFICIFTLLHYFYAKCTKRTIKFTIKDKGTLTHGSVQNGNGRVDTDFMVYTNNGKALKNVNCLWYWKWHSAEIQTKLQKGKKYSAEIYGWRVGGINLYPNIIKLKEIK